MEMGRPRSGVDATAGVEDNACACDHKALGVIEIEPARE